MKVDNFTYLGQAYNSCNGEENPSIDLLCLSPRPYEGPLPPVRPFTLVSPKTILWSSMRERPRMLHRGVEPTAIKSILDSPNCTRILIRIQALPLVLRSTIRDYIVHRPCGNSRLVYELKGEDRKEIDCQARVRVVCAEQAVCELTRQLYSS